MRVFPGESLLIEEFEKVRELACAECFGLPGRDAMAGVRIEVEFDLVLKILEEAEEMRKLLSDGVAFPLENYPDLRDSIKLLKIRNSTLPMQQVLHVRQVLVMARAVFQFFKGKEEKYMLLFRPLTGTSFDASVLNQIDSVIDAEGNVRSDASADLSRIRRQLGRKRAETEQVYQSVLSKYRKNGWLGETGESWRNGRRVISILAEQKRTARGIMHDMSATGKTCFIEPEEAIALNNQVISLETEERAEVDRIIRDLTNSIRSGLQLLKQYFDSLVRFDCITARARLALKMKACLPYVESRPVIRWVEARHPLLFVYNTAAGKHTIPFDLKLEEEQRILVISGPNAGGKTVCLKTVGLLQMMLQAGFLVTADGNSTFGIFRDLLVDIGDSQSLEFELSTYSSRLRHMREFIRKANPASLFLIDEFGTGTDPALGGALAESILEELNYRKAIGIVTTHYMNLKVLADRTSGIINGSMAFDAAKLEPLFRLEVGKPGSSYTFVVAERSGLPLSVVQRARKKVKKNTLLLEELLNKLEREKSEVARLVNANRSQEKKLRELVEKYEKNVVHQEKRQEVDEERVRQKELRLSRQFEDKFSRFVKDWKETRNKKAVLEKYTRSLQEKREQLSVKDKVHLEEVLAYNRQHIRKGGQVRLRNGRVTGVVESVRGDKVTVLSGSVRTVVTMQDIVLIEGKEKKKAKEDGN